MFDRIVYQESQTNNIYVNILITFDDCCSEFLFNRSLDLDLMAFLLLALFLAFEELRSLQLDLVELIFVFVNERSLTICCYFWFLVSCQLGLELLSYRFQLVEVVWNLASKFYASECKVWNALLRHLVTNRLESYYNYKLKLSAL